MMCIDVEEFKRRATQAEQTKPADTARVDPFERMGKRIETLERRAQETAAAQEKAAAQYQPRTGSVPMPAKSVADWARELQEGAMQQGALTKQYSPQTANIDPVARVAALEARLERVEVALFKHLVGM